MKLLNERNQVREVASRWREQYGSGTYRVDKRGRMVGDELAALDLETATADVVEEIIGYRGWVQMNTCHECGTETWDAVQLGEPPDYESHTSTICGPCLRAALRLLGD